MNHFQRQLYEQLMALVASNEAFYFQDFTSGVHTYRIFNYRLASYTDFQSPSALEARGIMFEVCGGVPVELKVLPQSKFFNAYENPYVMDLDFSKVDAIYDKLDGSLMSTYIEDGDLKLKSKGSIASEQALAAMKWLSGQPSFYEALRQSTIDGWTINLEYMSPTHRIVLGYPQTHCKVLNARVRETGSFVDYVTLQHVFGSHHVVSRIEVADTKTFYESIDNMTDVEGFVIWLSDGRVVKQKCSWYMSLHHAKDSVNNPRRLFEAILDEGIDDLRSMFSTDVVAMKMIDEMQVKVNHLYNAMVKAVEGFYEANKELDRKSYAIKAQEHFAGTLYFGQAMSRYLGKAVDYKGVLKSKYKELGFRDEKVENE